MTLSIYKLEGLTAVIAEKIMAVQLLHGKAIDLLSKRKIDSTVGASTVSLEPIQQAL